jgi:hypothetical protein
MNDSIRIKISKINEEKALCGYNELSGCTKDDIKVLQTWLEANFNVNNELFSEYLEFVSIANCLNHNGLYVYGLTEGGKLSIYYMNGVWRLTDEDDRYIFLGHNDISLFCINILMGEYHELDLGSRSFISAYASFDDMIDEALRIALI